MANYSDRYVGEGSVLVAGGTLACLVCAGDHFFRREVNMNTKGMTFMGLDWLNKSGDGAICSGCGYVHVFMDTKHSWRAPESAD